MQIINKNANFYVCEILHFLYYISRQARQSGLPEAVRVRSLILLAACKITEVHDMDFESLLTAVSVVGFPIVAYGAMFWYMMKSQEQHSQELQTIMLNHKEETDQLKEVLNRNTLALSELKNAISLLIQQKENRT